MSNNVIQLPYEPREVSPAEADQASDPGPLPDTYQYVPELEDAREALKGFEKASRVILEASLSLESASVIAAGVNPTWAWVQALSQACREATEEILRLTSEDGRLSAFFPQHLAVSVSGNSAAGAADEEPFFHADTTREEPVFCSCPDNGARGHEPKCLFHPCHA